MKVLVVEDELDVGAVFRDFLLELGHEPLLARSAEAALGALRSADPDAIILDMNLPGMSGLEFLQLRPIRESGLPIVAVSGVATEAQARECLRLGAFDFVGKPIPFERLRVVLTSLEPHAFFRREAEAGRHVERRRATRVPLGLPIRVTEHDGTQWETTSTNISAFGLKVRPVDGVRPGGSARISFTPPTGAPSIHVMSLLVRQDLDGYVFYFVSLTAGDFRRLAALGGGLSPTSEPS